MESLLLIIGVILLLAVANLLNPLRKAAGVIGAGVDTMSNVTDRKLVEIDLQSELDHAKFNTKIYAKAEALGEIKPASEVRKLLKSKYHITDED